MVSNNDFDGKATHLNCFYLYINFEQKYPKPAIVPLPQLRLWQIRLPYINQGGRICQPKITNSPPPPHF